MEVINYLFGYEKLKIVQNTDMFNFSLDSILLPNFVTINSKAKKILDIGCGNAPGSLILTTRTKARIIGVELQKEASLLASKSVLINNLQNQIDIINADINDYVKQMPTDSFDAIICNPPFFKYIETSNLNKLEYKTYARHEIYLNLDQIMHISKKLLKNNGVIALVHRPERLIDIIVAMKKNNIEPKRIQFVYPKKEKNANIVLIEGSKNGLPGLKVEFPLYAHNKDGTYTDEIKKYFSKG